jgi:hypothetical protein
MSTAALMPVDKLDLVCFTETVLGPNSICSTVQAAAAARAAAVKRKSVK